MLSLLYFIPSFPTTHIQLIIKSSCADLRIHFDYKHLSNLHTSYILIASSSHQHPLGKFCQLVSLPPVLLAVNPFSTIHPESSSLIKQPIVECLCLETFTTFHCPKDVQMSLQGPHGLACADPSCLTASHPGIFEKRDRRVPASFSPWELCTCISS